MRLIKLEEITEVLLRDGWHRVLNHSFKIETSQLGVRDNAGDKVPYWHESVTWEEESTGATNVICSITAPLHSILAVRERRS